MKKFYSILALAFMCMVGTISAETLTLNAETNRSNNPSISDGTVTFTLNNAKYERPSIIYHWERVYMVENNVDAYLNWELNDPSKTIKINSVEFLGRCEFNGNYITAETNYMPRPNVIIENRVFDFGKWYTTVVSGEFLFGPSEDLTGGEIHLVDHRANIANGGCQIQHITINYTIVEKAATQTVYATPENEVVFGGDWTEGEISEALEGTIPVRGGDEDLNGSEAGIVDITDVTGLTGRGEIITPNPNTLIEANEGQYNGSHNVLVDGVINNLVIVDPLMGGDPQYGGNYQNCGWYLTREGLKATKASYTRPMTYHYATVCIPFSYNAADVNANVEEIEEAYFEDFTITTMPVEEPNIEAGQTVIVFADQDIVIEAEDVDVATEPVPTSLVGTFTEKTIGMGEYAIAMDKFWNAGYADRGFMTVMPFRASFYGPDFFPGTEYSAKAISIVSKNATAINNVEAATTIAPAHNLMGVRVAPNAKGIVIVNGKKYFNK